MTITERPDGLIALDFPGGPFLTLTPEKYTELVKVIWKREARSG